jgi:hypothetical protein
MMINNNKIVWEKWKDPLSQQKDEWFPEQKEKPPEDTYFEEPYEEDVTEGIPAQYFMSNMGVVPYNPMEAINKMFNFWTGHTNFSITPDVAVKIEKIEGIEVLDILTRYRFRVGIAKLFRDRNVMNKIQDIVCENE